MTDWLYPVGSDSANWGDTDPDGDPLEPVLLLSGEAADMWGKEKYGPMRRWRTSMQHPVQFDDLVWVRENKPRAAVIGVGVVVSEPEWENGQYWFRLIHNLFDLGLLWLDDEYKVCLAGEIAKSQYRKLTGKPIELPRSRRDWPSRQRLKEHRDAAARRE